MSNTYQRDKQKAALRHLQDSSSDVIDYRSRLMFIQTLKKHPKMPPPVAKGLCDLRALWITLFEAPLLSARERRMKRLLKRKSKH